MALSPRALASLGVGYPPAVAARLGLWPDADQPPVELPAQSSGYAYAWRGPLPVAETLRRLRIRARGASRARVAARADAGRPAKASGIATARLRPGAHALLAPHAQGVSRAAVSGRVRVEPFVSGEEALLLAAWLMRRH